MSNPLENRLLKNKIKRGFTPPTSPVIISFSFDGMFFTLVKGTFLYICGIEWMQITPIVPFSAKTGLSSLSAESNLIPYLQTLMEVVVVIMLILRKLVKII